jgi:EAL domain-containing protein (putative c-di-GMP-specific phosphodiesterase class I)
MKGAEALLRWQRDGILTPPMEFIPFLEQSGMITKVENWIFGEVASKIKIWSDRGLNVVPVSVNISPASFGDPHIKDIIEAAFGKNGIAPDLFNFEIVERTFIDNLEYSGKLLSYLKGKGFGLSIDDFGTGYSSLSYLAELPFDYLKIDISFVRKMLLDKHSRYIVETIIYLSKKLNMKSIAEGVEAEEQLELLKELGCDYIQGFLLSEPLEETKFEKLLEN